MSEESSFPQSTHASSGAQPASSKITGILFPGLKRAGPEIEQTPPSGAEVKKKRSHITSPPTWVG